jgi:Uri superfamily endonuclease
MRDASFLSTAEPVSVKAEDTIEPLVVSLATAARLLGCSDRHVRTHLFEIPHIRIGGRLLFRVDSLRQWLIDSEQNGASTPQITASPKGGE